MRLLPLALAATLAPIAVSAQSLVEAGDPDRLVELLHEGATWPSAPPMASAIR